MNHAEGITDDLMRGIDVPGIYDGRPIRLHDVLEGELILGAELARIWKAPRAHQQEMLDDLQAEARRVCERFVDRYCQDEVNARKQDALEAAEEEHEA